MLRRLGLLAALFLLGLTSRAAASFHLMKIVEVFPGTAASPNAQYVVLEMYASGQSFVGGHSLLVSTATDGAFQTVAFMSNVTNGANQSRILIATPEAATLFGITPDFMVPTGALMPVGGGKICFDTIDCMIYGSHAAVGSDMPAGPATGLPLGKALIRRTDISGDPVLLEATDDTGNSANDFVAGFPMPINNAGANLCGNGVKSGFEECDDGNNVSGDGCSARCADEVCGNGIVSILEGCDDGNNVSGDGCSATCVREYCGDGLVLGTEQCDDGNTSNADGCLNTCQNATCGDGFVRTGMEQCDDGNMVNTDACAACQTAFCGDGIVRTGVENCDDGANNGMSSFCNSTCSGITGTVCGNGVTEAGEACDTAGDSATCDADCSLVMCGDLRTNLAAGETCDEGATLNGQPNHCANTCMGLTPSTCGNAIVEAGEPCDDGTASNGLPNKCNTACTGLTPSVCGNAIEEAGEACDEGTAINGTINHCATNCLSFTPATCGNDIVEWSETCDSGTENGTPNLCNAACSGITAAVCGNAVEEIGEDCDLGTRNGKGSSGCDASCRVVAASGSGGCTAVPRRGAAQNGGLAMAAILVGLAAALSRRKA